MSATSLVRLAKSYAEHERLKLSSVSTYAANDGKFFRRLDEGHAGCTLRRHDHLVEWFSNNWPDDLEWPADIPRPQSAAETTILPVSATCAGEASQSPSPVPFDDLDCRVIDKAFDLPVGRSVGDLPWASMREFLADLVGVICVFLIPLVLYFIGAFLQ